MKKTFILLPLLFLIGGCAQILPNSTSTTYTAPTSTPLDTEPTPPTYPSYPETPSIPGLANHAFDGRDFTIGRVLEKNNAYTRYFISYKSGELTISGIMNVPTGDGPFPILILNHGYIDPAIYTNGRGLRREQDFFARNGYVVVHPDYRNHAQSDDDPNYENSIRAGYIEDVINVVEAIKKSNLSYIDANKIGMLGHSMGGGITINVLVTKPDLIDAAVLYAPVHADARKNFDRWTRTRPAVAAEIIKRYGEPTADSEFWNSISAENFIENIQAPIMIHHGTNDKDVPLEWSYEFEKMLQDKSKSVTLHVYQNEGHEFGPQWTTFMNRSLEFFRATIK